MSNKSEELYKRIIELNKIPAEKHQDYSHRLPLISLIHELFNTHADFAMEKKVSEVLWNTQKEYLNKLKPATKTDAAQTSYVNMLRTCFGELRETILFVENHHKNDGMFTSLDREKFALALKNYPRGSIMRQFIGTMFLHMGDLLRYMHEYGICQIYYEASSFVYPELGQSYNQLGVFYESYRTSSHVSNRLMDIYAIPKAIYYYMRSAFAPVPFAAELNQKRIMAKVLEQFTNIPPPNPEVDEILLSLLAAIDQCVEIHNEDALFTGFRAALRGKVLDMEPRKFLELLVILVGANEMMNKTDRNKRIIRRLITEIYEILVGLLLNNFDSTWINLFHLYCMTLTEIIRLDLNRNPEIKSTFACISEIMELYLEQKLEPSNPFQDDFIDCFTPLRNLYQPELSYGSFHAFLKSIIGPKKEIDEASVVGPSEGTWD